eukprot:m.9802 g.9802  ORF g.9802 m.9802 type:complete len:179 (-) comp4135_c0_seq1:784-1320(-)
MHFLPENLGTAVYYYLLQTKHTSQKESITLGGGFSESDLEKIKLLSDLQSGLHKVDQDREPERDEIMQKMTHEEPKDSTQSSNELNFTSQFSRKNSLGNSSTKNNKDARRVTFASTDKVYYVEKYLDVKKKIDPRQSSRTSPRKSSVPISLRTSRTSPLYRNKNRNRILRGGQAVVVA